MFQITECPHHNCISHKNLITRHYLAALWLVSPTDTDLWLADNLAIHTSGHTSCRRVPSLMLRPREWHLFSRNCQHFNWKLIFVWKVFELKAKANIKRLLTLHDIFVLNFLDTKTLETEIDQASLQISGSPSGSWSCPLIPDWHTISLSAWSEIKYFTPLIMHWPGGHTLAPHWLTPGHVTRMLASDWSADECHMSQVTYLECVTLSGRTAHNLAFFVSSCLMSGGHQ